MTAGVDVEVFCVAATTGVAVERGACEEGGGGREDGEDDAFGRSPTFALPPKSLLSSLTEGMMAIEGVCEQGAWRRWEFSMGTEQGPPPVFSTWKSINL